jgi:hypothetical protein
LLSRTVAEINTLYQQLNWLETEDFKSEKMLTIKNILQDENEASASGKILEFKNILNRFDIRLSAAFFIFNTFLLWDL